MQIETERKFIFNPEGIMSDPLLGGGCIMKQAYFFTHPFLSARIRLMGANRYIFGMKTFRIRNSRLELEFELPKRVGSFLINKFKKVITKIRYKYKSPEGDIWELDYFESGLRLAEIESKDCDKVVLPYFIIKEVTENPYYLNASIFRRLYD